LSEGNHSNQCALVALVDSDLVARALYPPEWDERVKRGSPGCFKRNNTSVTKHTGLSFDEVVSYLKRDVEKPDSTVVVRAVGTIGVAKIKQLGLNYDPVVHFQAWEKPTANNPAHAELFPYTEAALVNQRKEVPRGLSRLISNALEVTVITPSGEIEEVIQPTADSPASTGA